MVSPRCRLIAVFALLGTMNSDMESPLAIPRWRRIMEAHGIHHLDTALRWWSPADFGSSDDGSCLSYHRLASWVPHGTLGIGAVQKMPFGSAEEGQCAIASRRIWSGTLMDSCPMPESDLSTLG
ncbi:hypothetical protein CGRA01v4_00315 [Colletotrichum graminicola]|uniref:Uncharacterized protein n=1 Tax=Colletotrichum graminicola (strain M1.001 / M2 / FGSC 10212) TaxID=645133 RepID=E3QHB5_COLGM|nr:uncharacterized protein GLRG_05421 [Colletotrichum graminicola M1.001]EFQ30277.1 hypothetical protein GLRG_05421 [Colletotrichum graminicola M1.001]WDK09037.1 hypothetical protein CGRA01v4_00315 [Colletotrichum graminicola]